MIEEVIDGRLQNKYNVSSIWKVAEIAMACIEMNAKRRPTMATICNELAEAIILGEGYESLDVATGEVPPHSYVQPR